MKTCGCDSEQSSLKLVYLQPLGLYEQNSCPRYGTFLVLAVVGSPVSLHVNVTGFSFPFRGRCGCHFNSVLSFPVCFIAWCHMVSSHML